MRSDITWIPPAPPSPDDALWSGLRAAQASALLYVTACMANRLDTDGTNIYVATQQAKACGATHGQITAAMRRGVGE